GALAVLIRLTDVVGRRAEVLRARADGARHGGAAPAGEPGERRLERVDAIDHALGLRGLRAEHAPLAEPAADVAGGHAAALRHRFDEHVVGLVDLRLFRGTRLVAERFERIALDLVLARGDQRRLHARHLLGLGPV